MLKKSRLFYFSITLLVIVSGILSRKINGIPFFIGDILYAVMVYFGCRMIFIDSTTPKKIVLPLLLCYLIEIQQLYDAAWLLQIRQTTLGHYALGEGFVWSDLGCYTVGVFIAFAIDFKWLKNSIKS